MVLHWPNSYTNTGQKVVTNPVQTHAFAKMKISRNKTDKADAISIARYCHYLHEKGTTDKCLFTPKEEAFRRAQLLVTRLEQLNKMRSQEHNRLDGSLDKAAARSVASMVLFIAKQISSYAGLNPRIEQSGSSIHRSNLSKVGCARLRKSL